MFEELKYVWTFSLHCSDCAGGLCQVGLDGTGKSTVVHLASYIALCEIMRLKLHKNYDMSEFRDDLKNIFIQSGVKGIKTVFLLADSDIVKVSVCCIMLFFILFSFFQQQYLYCSVQVCMLRHSNNENVGTCVRNIGRQRNPHKWLASRKI